MTDSDQTKATRRVLDFLSNVVADLFSHMKKIVARCFSLFRRGKAKRSVREYEVLVAEKLAKHGLGPDRLRQRLQDLDERIESVKAAGASSKAIETERRGVLVQIYQATPANDEEHQEIVSARETLANAEQTIATETEQISDTSLLPQDAAHFGRLGLGYGVIALVCYLVFWPDPTPAQPIAGLDNAEFSQALGLVVSGWRLTRPDGDQTDIPEVTGTCFSISPDGFLVTNQHVVAEYEKGLKANAFRDRLLKEKDIIIEPKLWVFFDGQEYEASLVHSDQTYDLAVVATPRKEQPFFRLAKSKEQPRGTDVYALGFPAIASKPMSDNEVAAEIVRSKKSLLVGEKLTPTQLEFSMTKGIISRSIESDNVNWLQHNADINSGNSGGPLVTANGTVVGVNTLAIKATKGHGVFYSFTIPQVRSILEDHVDFLEEESD